MTDTPYKSRNLRAIEQPARPTTFWSRGGGAVRSDKTAALWRAQDTALVGRRIVAQCGPGSPSVRIPADVDPYSPIGVQSYPALNESFELMAAEGRLMPGSWLEVRALVFNTGPTQATGIPSGVAGSVKIDATLTNLDTVAQAIIERDITPPPSGISFAALPDGPGAYFDSLRPMFTGPLRPEPPEAIDKAAEFSESVNRGVKVSAVSAVRVVSACVSQVPWTYATPAASADETAHAASLLQSPDAQPRTETPDGTTHNDDRFGTLRTLTAAENQPRRLGPVLMMWTSYDASAWQPGDANTPLLVTLPALGIPQRVNALDTSETVYSADSPGWPLMTHLAQTWDESGPECMREQAAAVPCTLYVRYFGTVTGSAYAVIRTARSSVRVQLATRGVPGWEIATGHIEGSASTEDALGGVAQIWLEGDDCSISLLDVVLEFGHIKT